MDDNKKLPEYKQETPSQKSIGNQLQSVDEKKTEEDNHHDLNKKDETLCCSKCRSCRKKAN